jgi:hypothetical protein
MTRDLRVLSMRALGASSLARAWLLLFSLVLVLVSVPVFAGVPWFLGAFGVVWVALTILRGAWFVGLSLDSERVEIRTMYRRVRLKRTDVTLLRASLSPLEIVVATGSSWILFRSVGRPGLTARARRQCVVRLERLARELGVPLEIVDPHDPVPEGVAVGRAERSGQRNPVVGWPLFVAVGVSLLAAFL